MVQSLPIHNNISDTYHNIVTYWGLTSQAISILLTKKEPTVPKKKHKFYITVINMYKSITTSTFRKIMIPNCLASYKEILHDQYNISRTFMKPAPKLLHSYLQYHKLRRPNHYPKIHLNITNCISHISSYNFEHRDYWRYYHCYR